MSEFRISVRSTEKEKKELKRVAKVTGIPQSTIIRDAIAEKIAELNQRVKNGEKFGVGVVSRSAECV